MNNSIQILLLDLGGVIYKIDWFRTNEALDLPPSIDWWHWPEYDAYERGHLTTQGFQKTMEQKTSRQWSESHFKSALQKTIVAPLSGIEDLLKRVTIPLCALSNTNEAHRDFFIHDAVMKLFRDIFMSFELGMRKPELAIYEKTCELLNVRANEILFIDDRKDNLKGAAQVGFQTAQTLDDTQKLEAILKSHGLIG